MQLHLLFNAIILTLSLATLLLTLVSYSVYKFRQLPFEETNKQRQFKVEGVFFKRYLSPGLLLEYFPPQTVHENKKKSLFSPITRNLGAFFAIIASIIFISFLVEALFNRNPHFFDGKGYADRVKELQAKGLYEHYTSNHSFDTLSLDETAPNPALNQSDYLLDELRKKTVQLFISDQNKKFNPVASKLALNAWIDFLKGHQIPYTTTASVPMPSANAILVLPQVAVLSAQQKAQVDSFIAHSGNLLATGPIGVLEGDGKPNSGSWSSAALSVQFSEVSNPQEKLNTWISGNGAPWWEIPPGVQINWPIIDSRYRASMSDGAVDRTVAMWEIRNELAGESARAPRAILNSKDGKRTVWTLLDPAVFTRETGTAKQTYQDLAFYSMLAWAARIPIAKVANWPDGKKMVVVPAVEVRTIDGNTKDLSHTLDELKIPASYFMNSDQAKALASFYKRMPSTSEVILSLNEETDLSSKDAKAQFESIEKARLESEYQTGSPTLGFHVLSGSYNIDTIKSLLQNRIQYLSGNTQYLRLAPSLISNGEFMILPGSFVNDLEENDAKEARDTTELKKRFASVVEIASELQGMYVFQIRPEIFSEKSYEDVIPATLKSLKENPDVSFLSMSEAVKWWRSKNQLRLMISKGKMPTLPTVNVSNLSGDLTTKISVWVDNGKTAKLIPIGNLGGLSESNITLQE